MLGGLSVAALRRGGRTSLWEGPTTVVQRGPLTISISASGTVHPREQVILRNDLDRDAKITFIVPEGKQVKKGELLVVLDTTDLEQRVAERRQIIRQFLMETVVLSSLGGFLGMLLGLLIPLLITHFAGMLTIVTPVSLLLSLGISMGSGIVFGLYPAARAARLGPIVAWRHE